MRYNGYMKTCFELFVDELGTANIKSKNSDIYVLSGCAVDEVQRENLKIKADQIKFKFFGRTDIGFHSRDMGLHGGDFVIFRKKLELWKEFLKDLFKFLTDGQYVLFAVVCDKKLAGEKGWNSVKLIKATSRKLIYHYLSWLFGLKRGSGKITIESATAEKDRYYLNEFAYFLSPGCKELSVSFRDVQTVLTSISFVTKHNDDIEEQLADMFAYAMRCAYLRESGQAAFKVGSYEDRLIKIMKLKLFIKPKLAKERKMKFYETIQPFCILPEDEKP